MFFLYCILMRNFDLVFKIWFDHFFCRKHAATACQDRNVRYELNIELK